MDADPVEFPIGRGAEMIFDVARTADILGVGRAAREFVEDRAIGLAHHVGEHVEPAAMRHAEHDLAHAVLAAVFDHAFERGDHALAAIEAEALGADVFLAEELLVLRSEEHTSELQSLMRKSYAVLWLKKKHKTTAQ